MRGLLRVGLLAVVTVALPYRAAEPIAPLWPEPRPLPLGAVTRCNKTPECYRVCADTVWKHAKIAGPQFVLFPVRDTNGKLLGVRIRATGPGTFFALLGVASTDVLVRVDDEEVDTSTVVGAIERTRAKSKVRYTFLRQGRPVVITVLNRKC